MMNIISSFSTKKNFSGGNFSKENSIFPLKYHKNQFNRGISTFQNSNTTRKWNLNAKKIENISRYSEDFIGKRGFSSKMERQQTRRKNYLNPKALNTLQWTDMRSNPYAKHMDATLDAEGEQIDYLARFRLWKEKLQNLNVMWNPESDLPSEEAEKRVFKEIEKKRRRMESKLNRTLTESEALYIESEAMERNIELFINFRPDKYTLYRPSMPYAGSNIEEKEELSEYTKNMENEDGLVYHDPPEAYQWRKDSILNKFCAVCANEMELDAMNIGLLFKGMTEFGSIKSRYETGYCAKHQRRLSKLIKRGKHMGFMSYKKKQFTINSIVDPDYWMDWAADKRQLSESEVDRLFSTNKLIEDPVDEQVDTSFVPFSITDVNLEDFRIHVEGLLKSVSKEDLVFDHDSRLQSAQLDRTAVWHLEDQAVDDYFEEELGTVEEGEIDPPYPVGPPESDETGLYVVNDENDNLPDEEELLAGRSFSRAIIAMGEQLRIQSENIVKEDYIPAGLSPEKGEELIKILNGIIDECLEPYDIVLTPEGQLLWTGENEEGEGGEFLLDSEEAEEEEEFQKRI
eukprot:TRINITY_DN11493_c0_g1_i1.p1 TRINITY_DN11493_c0_g1~~TRINITY_DN11493_c0_g1_i1.p1  ORF type:complete len:591 (+),score=227.94 TRINITY_DN11493_c0_g1_i1:63-1775(+)